MLRGNPKGFPPGLAPLGLRNKVMGTAGGRKRGLLVGETRYYKSVSVRCLFQIRRFLLDIRLLELIYIGVDRF